MILKLIKFIFLLLIMVTVAYYVIYDQKPELSKLIPSSSYLGNSGNTVKYKKQLNDGILTLIAENAGLKSKNCVLLKNVRATFNRKNETVAVNCKTCEFKTKEKKAYLYGQVYIKSSDTTLYTDFAIVNFSNNSMSGNSKIHGTRSGTKFTASEFTISKNGQITLKYAKIIKER